MAARRAPSWRLSPSLRRSATNGVVPFPAPPMSVWERLFAVADQTDNRGADGARRRPGVRRFQPACPVWSPGVGCDAPSFGWIGRELSVDGVPSVGLLAQKLKEALSRAGYELESVIPSWREAGVLVENPAYRPPYLAKKKMSGTQVRLYVFTPDVFAAPDDEDGE